MSNVPDGLTVSKDNLDEDKVYYGAIIDRKFIKKFSELVDQNIYRKLLCYANSLKTLLRSSALQRRTIDKKSNPSVVRT